MADPAAINGARIVAMDMCLKDGLNMVRFSSEWVNKRLVDV
jgi:hypothetical protein